MAQRGDLESPASRLTALLHRPPRRRSHQPLGRRPGRTAGDPHLPGPTGGRHLPGRRRRPHRPRGARAVRGRRVQRGREPADSERLEAHQRFRRVMNWDHFHEHRLQLTIRGSTPPTKQNPQRPCRFHQSRSTGTRPRASPRRRSGSVRGEGHRPDLHLSAAGRQGIADGRAAGRIPQAGDTAADDGEQRAVGGEGHRLDSAGVAGERSAGRDEGRELRCGERGVRCGRRL